MPKGTEAQQHYPSPVIDGGVVAVESAYYIPEGDMEIAPWEEWVEFCRERGMPLDE